MRSDLFHYYSKGIEDVYNAYASSIKTVLEKDMEGTPYSTITFGLNFSFKYNMNGGFCNLHFMKYQGGTAVGARYTVAQAFGARYKAMDQDVVKEVQRLIGSVAKDIEFEMDDFLKLKEQSQNQKEETPNPQSTPEVSAPSTNSTVNMEKARFCHQCGRAFGESDAFCANCGSRRM